MALTGSYGGPTTTGYGVAIDFGGTMPGNVVLESAARIYGYNQDVNDNGFALGFATRPNASSAPVERVTILRGGNVGIGTTTPSHKLAVNGAIRAKEVIVDTGWSDYVFADGYRLAPLTEVEAHIKSERHLPGIPSAAQVAENGVSVGEMQARLLAKVEELTLHLIAQEKRTQAHQEEIATLRAELSCVSKR